MSKDFLIVGYSNGESVEAVICDLCKLGQEESRLWLFSIQFSHLLLPRKGISKERHNCCRLVGNRVGAVVRPGPAVKSEGYAERVCDAEICKGRVGGILPWQPDSFLV